MEGGRTVCTSVAGRGKEEGDDDEGCCCTIAKLR